MICVYVYYYIVILFIVLNLWYCIMYFVEINKLNHSFIINIHFYMYTVWGVSFFNLCPGNFKSSCFVLSSLAAFELLWKKPTHFLILPSGALKPGLAIILLTPKLMVCAAHPRMSHLRIFPALVMLEALSDTRTGKLIVVGRLNSSTHSLITWQLSLQCDLHPLI